MAGTCTSKPAWYPDTPAAGAVLGAGWAMRALKVATPPLGCCSVARGRLIRYTAVFACPTGAVLEVKRLGQRGYQLLYDGASCLPADGPGVAWAGCPAECFRGSVGIRRPKRSCSSMCATLQAYALVTVCVIAISYYARGLLRFARANLAEYESAASKSGVRQRASAKRFSQPE